MVAALTVSPRAGRDFEEIWDYTADHWNTAQADDYIRDLQKAMEVLTAKPEMGRTCDDIRPGYRKHAVGSHFIYYCMADTGIEVIRVLHQRMNVETHL